MTVTPALPVPYLTSSVILLYCFTALSDTQGNFLLNGNFVVSMAKKEINIQGAVFEYSGSNNSIERINSTDRLEAELVLQVRVQRQQRDRAAVLLVD